MFLCTKWLDWKSFLLTQRTCSKWWICNKTANFPYEWGTAATVESGDEIISLQGAIRRLRPSIAVFIFVTKTWGILYFFNPKKRGKEITSVEYFGKLSTSWNFKESTTFLFFLLPHLQSHKDFFFFLKKMFLFLSLAREALFFARREIKIENSGSHAPPPLI